MARKPTYEELQSRVQELEKAEIERKQAVEALKESEKRMKALSEAAFEAIFLSENGICLDQNLSAKIMFGYTRTEAIGRHGTEWITPEDREKVKSKMQAGLEGPYEVTGLRKDGTTFPCEIQARMMEHNGRSIRVTALRDISERIMAEEKLKESEARYRKIFYNLQDVYYETDLGGTIIEVSPSIEKMSQYSRMELIGKSLYDIYSDKTEREKFIAQIIENGMVSDYELYLKDKDGSRHLCSASTILLRDRQGSPLKLIGSLRDISVRKQAEESLRQVKEWTETILQTIQSGVLVIDARTKKIVDINRAAEEMIGANKDEIVGRQCHNFICPNARGQCPVADSGQKIDDHETILIGKDGRRTEILKTVNRAIVDGRQLLIESFVDISQRKQAEKSARAHQERFKTFFSSVNDAIFVHPLQKEGFAPFMEVNDIACRRYGYTRDEFLKLTAMDITQRENAKAHANARHRKKLLETKHLFFEATHITKSGEQFPVEINSNIVEQYGQPVILAVVRDISERKRAEAEKSKIEAEYRQAQKVEAIGRLAGGVAHDLNNILSPIIGYGELLLVDLAATDKRRKSVQQIVKAGHRARDLVHQLLAFGRKQTLEYKTTNLNAAIERFESLLRRTIREDIEIEILASADIPHIKADIGQIEQVLMNLCVNAQDAMPEGGRLTLATTVIAMDEKSVWDKPGLQPGPYIMLTVADTGCGVDKGNLENIFEPFFSTKGEHGTGLGLSTVYGIVKQHGGHIWVDSAPGKGSTFKVYLPATDETGIEKKTEDRPLDEFKGTETVLLVEDNAQVRRLSRDILKRQGYAVLTAQSGAEALEILASNHDKVALLLTDVIMPDINGRELYTQIARQYPGIKVLFMSGYTDDVIAHHGVLEQGFQFIQKPFSVQSLSIKVREVLDRSGEL